MAKRSKTFQTKKDGKTVGFGAYWNDLMTYDGTKEDYYSDSWQIGLWDVFTGGYVSAERNRRETNQRMADYMEMYGIDWSDIKYPALTSGFSSTANATRSGVQFVSDNVKSLYR